MVRPPGAGVVMRNTQYADKIREKAPPVRNALPPGFPIGCGQAGSGSPLVLLHCSGSDRQHWSRCLKAWGEIAGPPRGFIMPELFGCGATGRWPGRGHPSLQDYAALVCRSLDGTDGPIDLVGHSFGGAVALQIARERPERIASLTLIEPAAFFVLREQGAEEARLLDEFATLGATVQRAGASERRAERLNGMRCFVEYWNGAGRWDALSPGLQEAMADMVGVVAGDVAAALVETSRLADYAGLPVPTLLVSGQHSPAPVRHMNAMLAQALRVTRAVSIIGAGHMTPISHAPVLARLIADHADTSRSQPRF